MLDAREEDEALRGAAFPLHRKRVKPRALSLLSLCTSPAWAAAKRVEAPGTLPATRLSAQPLAPVLVTRKGKNKWPRYEVDKDKSTWISKERNEPVTEVGAVRDSWESWRDTTASVDYGGTEDFNGKALCIGLMV